MSSVSAPEWPGPFFIHISGLPKGYTWQDLKDVIRAKARTGIWTEMESSNGRPTGSGYARVKRPDEAWKLYSYLIGDELEDMRLQVHVFDISTSPPKPVRCNCGAGTHLPSYAEARRVAAQTYSSAWQLAETSPPMVPAYTTAPYVQYSYTVTTGPSAIDPRQALSQQMAEMRIQQQREQARIHIQQSYPQQQYQQLQTQPRQSSRPVYTSSSTGTPINIASGYARKESRGVFVQGIDFRMRSKDVEDYFSRVGEIIHCKLQRDDRGKSKGNAEILYASAEDAQRAIAKYHRHVWQGRQLSVRADKESTTIATPAATQPSASGSRDPVIVNGSVGAGRHQVGST